MTLPEDELESLMRYQIGAVATVTRVMGWPNPCQAPWRAEQSGMHRPADDVACDVFEEDPLGRAFPDDASHLGPEVAGIIGTAALSGGAEGLAGVPCEDDIESSAERAGIEGAQITPDWHRGKIASALGTKEDASG